MNAEIVELDAEAAKAAVQELGDVLADCVDGGASVSFMAPYTLVEATAYFRGVAAEVEKGKTHLLAARLNGRIVGTVQLGIVDIPNQPHRGEVKKMLVHRSARGAGIAAALLGALEDVARARGRTLLVLDTVTDSTADRLYRRLGWQPFGTVPNYALWPDGRYCDATFFWKSL